MITWLPYACVLRSAFGSVVHSSPPIAELGRSRQVVEIVDRASSSDWLTTV